VFVHVFSKESFGWFLFFLNGQVEWCFVVFVVGCKECRWVMLYVVGVFVVETVGCGE